MDENKISILYVDDEENNLVSFKATFRIKYKVYTAISGAEALDILAKNLIHIIITDQREGNKQNNATYWAARIVCYGFLAIIGVISLFNIVNSISMSVSARIKQYGAMRAVGMDNRQLKRMISAEAYTYAISGLIVGCGIGLPLSRFLYNRLITHYFGIEWRFPILWFGIVVAFIFISAIVSVYAPAKRIRNMSITATINEL